MKYVTVSVKYTDGEEEKIEQVKRGTIDFFQDRITFISKTSGAYELNINKVLQWTIEPDIKTEEDETRKEILELLEDTQKFLTKADELTNGISENSYDLLTPRQEIQQLMNTIRCEINFQ